MHSIRGGARRSLSSTQAPQRRSVLKHEEPSSGKTPSISLSEHLLASTFNPNPIKQPATSYPSLDLGWGRIFGGQLVAQALDSGLQSQPGKKCNSIRTRFLSSGDVRLPVVHEIRTIRTGKSFAWESVHSKQVSHDKKRSYLAASVASFQAPSTNSRVWHDDTEKNFGPFLDSILPPEKSNDAKAWIIGFDVKECQHKDDGRLITVKDDRVRAIWIRRTDISRQWTSKDDQVALGYTSDYYFLRAALEQHNLWIFDPDLRAASLCHSIFFHRDLDLSKWHLFLVRAPTAHGGRAFVEGEFLNPIKRERVATVYQEGLVWQRNSSGTSVNQNSSNTSRPKESSKPVTNGSHEAFTVNPKSELQRWLASPVTELKDGVTACKEFGWGRMYGGQLLGQAILVAASKAHHQHASSSNQYQPAMFLHSLHSHFVQGGKTNTEAKYQARTERRGQVYTVVSVETTQQQSSSAIFRADASFAAVTEDDATKGSGIDHDEFLADENEVKARFERLAEEDRAGNPVLEFAMPFQYRNRLLPEMGLDFRQDFQFGSDVQWVFVRSKHQVESSAMNQALLAYAADCVFPPTATLRHHHDLNMWDSLSSSFASLCSSLYFHRDFSISDEWLCLRSSCQIMADDRALVKIDVFRDWGKQRVATGVQEVLVRLSGKKTSTK